MGSLNATKKSNRLRFRVRLWPVLRVYLAGYLVCILIPALVIAIATGYTPPSYLDASLRVLCGCLPAFGLSFGAVRRFPVTLDEAAIDGFDILGFPVSAGWAAFRDVRPFSFLGLRYLRVRSLAHQSVLWLPLHLLDFERFVDTVLTHAGEDHPLTQELYRQLRAD